MMMEVRSHNRALLVTQIFQFELGGSFASSQAVRRFRTVTDVFQLKIYLDEIQSYIASAS